MSRSNQAGLPTSRSFPANSWYVAANSAEVTRQLLSRRMLDIPVLLFRTSTGSVSALEDRCAHRAYPLSKGRLDGDRVVCGYHGFEYDTAGQCVRVPSQAHVPFGAQVRSLPVQDDGTFIWIWAGAPAMAELRRPPGVPWLGDPSWSTIGGQDDVAAAYLLLHETFADVTHVPFIDPEVAPPALQAMPPPLDIEVTETSVSFSRNYPATALAEWHWRATGLSPQEQYEQRETGRFVAPGLWLDRWDVHAEDPTTGQLGDYSLRFTQAVTPVTDTTSGLVWRISRDFSVGDTSVDTTLRAAFSQYYTRVKEAVETVQATVDAGDSRRDVDVISDGAALQVRRVVRAMIAEETGKAGHARKTALRGTGV